MRLSFAPRPFEYLNNIFGSIFNNGGPLSSTEFFATLPRHHEQKAEKFIAIGQLVLALLILTTHYFWHGAFNLSTLNPMVFVATGILIASSAIRCASASSRKRLADWLLDIITFVDALALFSLATSIYPQNDTALGSVLLGQSSLWLLAFVALRLVRTHPRPVFVSGVAMLSVWSIYLYFNQSLAPNFTGQEGTGLFWSTVLALAVLVVLTTYGAWYARKSLIHLNSTLESMPHGVAMFDKDHRLVVSNSRYSELYGLRDRHRHPGTSIADLIKFRYENGCFGTVDFSTHSKDWMEDFVGVRSELQELDNGHVYSIRRQQKAGGQIVTTTEDITHEKKLQNRVEHLSNHDALTGLANRKLLLSRIDRALKQSRNRPNIAVYCVDLHRFREINENFGHEGGDTLLKAVAARLLNCIRESDMLARIGEDDFVILQIGQSSHDVAEIMARRMINNISAPYDIDGHQVVTGVDIGIAFPKDRDTSADALLSHADIALHRAKGSGESNYVFYEETMSHELRERRILENDLKAAIEDGAFELHYQPILNAQSRRIESVEALIRWNHPEKGNIPPGIFIPVVDEIGEACNLGSWVIRRACEQAMNFPDNVKVSVNVSAAQFDQSGLVDVVRIALNNSGFPANRLELEITETVLLKSNATTIGMLNSLRKLGVSIALDDFGTGYSSLSYLQKFPFDRLKIDRSFIKDATEDSYSHEIVKTIVDLGCRLDMAITAEGVETEEQLERIAADGCTSIQGFHISKPLPLEELLAFLSNQKVQRRIKAPQLVHSKPKMIA